MGHIWGESLTTDKYQDSAFRRGFDLLRGRIKPVAHTPSTAQDPDEWFMPPLDMQTTLAMAAEPPLVVWAFATGVEPVAEMVAALGPDPQEWDPDLLYAFCKTAQIHPASLTPHENGIALPLAIVHALQLTLLDETVAPVDRKIAVNALKVESTNAKNIVMQAPIIAQLALTVRRWCNYMATQEGEHNPYMTNIGQRMATHYFEAAQAMGDLRGNNIWACLPGLRTTLQEMAESNFYRHQQAITDYNAHALKRTSLGMALFGPKPYKDLAESMLNRTRIRAADNLSDHFNTLAYIAVTEPSLLCDTGIDRDATWRAPKMGYQDVPDMALAFVRLQEKIMGTVQTEVMMQMQRPVLERCTNLVEGAFGFDQAERDLLDRTILRAMRNLETINGEAHGLYPVELDLIFPVPERTLITGPPKHNLESL